MMSSAPFSTDGSLWGGPSGVCLGLCDVPGWLQHPVEQGGGGGVGGLVGGWVGG